MPAGFQLADYVLGGLAVAFALLGLFRGFSGTLGAMAGAVVAAVAGSLCWRFSSEFVVAAWLRALATLVMALLGFGLARLVVKKIVNRLLAQPTDSILGMAVGAALGVSIAIGWAYSGFHLEYSLVASRIAEIL